MTARMIVCHLLLVEANVCCQMICTPILTDFICFVLFWLIVALFCDTFVPGALQLILHVVCHQTTLYRNCFWHFFHIILNKLFQIFAETFQININEIIRSGRYRPTIKLLTVFKSQQSLEIIFHVQIWSAQSCLSNLLCKWLAQTIENHCKSMNDFLRSRSNEMAPEWIDHEEYLKAFASSLMNLYTHG